jgi:hypothetical protein
MCVGLACGVELCIELTDADHSYSGDRFSIDQPGIKEEWRRYPSYQFAQRIDWFIRSIGAIEKPYEYGGIYRELIAVEFEKGGYVLRVAKEKPRLTITESKLEHGHQAKHNLEPKIVTSN